MPKEQRQQIISENHDAATACHFGKFKTIAKVMAAYFWPKMVSDIANYVRNCEVCKAVKPYNQITTPPAGGSVEAKRPFRIVATDICGPFPLSTRSNQYLLVAIDLFSKFTILRAVRNATATIICDFIENDVILRYGCPEIIVTDNGVQYRADLFSKLTEKYGIRQWFTANYFAQANPTECANKTIGTALRTFLREDMNHREWDKHVNIIANAMNAAVHTSTDSTPHEVVFGRKMVQRGNEHQLLLDVNDTSESISPNREKFHEQIQLRLNAAKERADKRYNLRTREVKYNVGDIVYRKNTILSDASKSFTKKLAPRYVKCQIVEKTGTNTYKLKEIVTGRVSIHHAINFHK